MEVSGREAMEPHATYIIAQMREIILQNALIS
jgi:hypothetical protein